MFDLPDVDEEATAPRAAQGSITSFAFDYDPLCLHSSPTASLATSSKSPQPSTSAYHPTPPSPQPSTSAHHPTPHTSVELEPYAPQSQSQMSSSLSSPSSSIITGPAHLSQYQHEEEIASDADSYEDCEVDNEEEEVNPVAPCRNFVNKNKKTRARKSKSFKIASHIKQKRGKGLSHQIHHAAGLTKCVTKANQKAQGQSVHKDSLDLHSVFGLLSSKWKGPETVALPPRLDLRTASLDHGDNVDLLEKIIDALNYVHAVQNVVFYQVGNLIVSSSRDGTKRKDKAKQLAEMLYSKKIREYKELLVLHAEGGLQVDNKRPCKICMSALKSSSPTEGGHCCLVDLLSTFISARYNNMSERSLTRMARCAEILGPAALDQLCLPFATIHPCMFLEAVQEFVPTLLDRAAFGEGLSTDSIFVKEINPAQYKVFEVYVCDIYFPDGDGLIVKRPLDRQLLDFAGVSMNTEIAFRFEGLDAPEMETGVKRFPNKNTKIPDLECYPGNNALRYVRRIVSSSVSDKLKLRCKVDGKGKAFKGFHGRLICRPMVLVKLGEWEDLGELLLSQGLVYLYPAFGVCPTYARAMLKAKSFGLGLFEFPPKVLAKMIPRDFRNSIADHPAVRLEDGERVYTISNLRGSGRKIMDAEKLLCIRPSKLENAGDGLFLEPHAATIKANDIICLYNYKTHATPPARADRDYLVEVEDKGKSLFVDGDSHAIFFGPMANDKEFTAAFKAIDFGESGGGSRGSSRHTIHKDLLDSCWWNSFGQYRHLSNCKFSRVGARTYVKAAKDLPPSTEPTELFVGYGIRNFWITALQDAFAKPGNDLTEFEKFLKGCAAKLAKCEKSVICQQMFGGGGLKV